MIMQSLYRLLPMTNKLRGMPDMMEKLLEIQQKDKKLTELVDRMQSEPARVNSLKEDCNAKKEKVAESKESQKQITVKRNSLETEVGSLTEKINKCQGQLYQLKSNEEYRAMEKEIDGLIAKKSDMEDQILQYLEDFDEAGKYVTSTEGVLKEADKALAQEEAKLKEDLAVMESEKKELESAIDSMSKEINPAVYKTYLRIAKKSPGEAIVPLEDGICGGCHMLLPPNSLNEVMKSTETNIVTCSNCARILYYNKQQ